MGRFASKAGKTVGITVVGLAGFLAGVLGGFLGGAVPAQAGWWDDLDRGEQVSLSDLVAQPSRYEDRTVSFFCVFHRRDQVFAPLAAPYTAQRHENLAVWPDGAAVWEEGEYRKDYPFLYLDRSHPQAAELLGLESFTRLEVTGRLRGAIRARPCVDVVSFRPTSHRLGRAVVQSVIAGDRYAELGDRELAYENYLRALQPDLPPAYDLVLRRRVAESLRRLGRDAEASTVERSPTLGGSNPPAEQDRPPGGLLGDPLPGTEGAPSGLASGPAPGPAPGAPPGPAPSPLTRDLPGSPEAPAPLSSDLPGTPISEVPPAALPPSALPPVVPPARPPPLSPPAAVGQPLPPAGGPRGLPPPTVVPGSPGASPPGFPRAAPAGPPPTSPASPSPAPPLASPPLATPADPPADPPAVLEPDLPGAPVTPRAAPPRHTPRLSGVK